jgi:hypothetical protein
MKNAARYRFVVIVFVFIIDQVIEMILTRRYAVNQPKILLEREITTVGPTPTNQLRSFVQMRNVVKVNKPHFHGACVAPTDYLQYWKNDK